VAEVLLNMKVAQKEWVVVGQECLQDLARLLRLDQRMEFVEDSWRTASDLAIHHRWIVD
jgi:hypothetical protein